MHAHPEDLRQILALRQAPAAPLDRGEFGTLHAFVRVCELLEPQLVWPNGNARVRWLTSLSHAKFYIEKWSSIGSTQPGGHPQLEFEVVNELATLAERFWRGPTRGPIRQLPFALFQLHPPIISDNKTTSTPGKVANCLSFVKKV